MTNDIDITKKKTNGIESLPEPSPASPHPEPETYKLSPQERETMIQAMTLENSLKLRIYDLQTQLEAIQRDLIGAVAQRRGALAMLTQSRNWQDATLSDDLATLTKRELPQRPLF